MERDGLVKRWRRKPRPREAWHEDEERDPYNHPLRYWLEIATLDSFVDWYMGMTSFKDIFGKVAKKGAAFEVEDADFEQQFPILYMLMSKTAEDDGKPRVTSTLSLKCEGGVVKAGLVEKNHNLSLWVSAASLGGVFATLEEALNSTPPQWRKLPPEYKGKQR